MKKYLIALFGVVMVATAHAASAAEPNNSLCVTVYPTSVDRALLEDVDLKGERKRNFIVSLIGDMNSDGRRWCYDAVVDAYARECVNFYTIPCYSQCDHLEGVAYFPCEKSCEKQRDKCFDRGMKFASKLIDAHNAVVAEKNAGVNEVEDQGHTRLREKKIEWIKKDEAPIATDFYIEEEMNFASNPIDAHNAVAEERKAGVNEVEDQGRTRLREKKIEWIKKDEPIATDFYIEWD